MSRRRWTGRKYVGGYAPDRHLQRRKLGRGQYVYWCGRHDGGMAGSTSREATTCPRCIAAYDEAHPSHAAQ